MKNLVVGDTHCKIDEVKFAVNRFKNGNYSKLIFIGDYVDSFTASDKQMIECLQLIINTKRELGDSCILLLGNHDVQYLYYPHYRCTGFRKSILTPIQLMFKENEDCFQWYYYDEDTKTLFSHAGVNSRWLQQVNAHTRTENVFQLLAELPHTQKGLDLLCQCGESRGGYRHDAGGIVWCDKSELEVFPYFDNNIQHQVVGHTALKEINYWKNISENTITFIDVLDKNPNLYYDC